MHIYIVLIWPQGSASDRSRFTSCHDVILLTHFSYSMTMTPKQEHNTEHKKQANLVCASAGHIEARRESVQDNRHYN